MKRNKNFLGMEPPEKGIAATLVLFLLCIREFATQLFLFQYYFISLFGDEETRSQKD